MKIQKAITIIVFASIAAFASEAVSELGFNVGWGNPMGESVEYAQEVAPGHRFGAGAGISAAGIKAGIDYAYLFVSAKRVSPYVGGAVSIASGLSDLQVNVNSDTANYDLKGGLVIAPRAGLRIAIRRIHFYLNFGYGFTLAGGGAEYQDGSTSSSVRKFAKALGIGGVEGSGSVMRWTPCPGHGWLMFKLDPKPTSSPRGYQNILGLVSCTQGADGFFFR
ncbi:MAG TPA: hypothetical protein VLM37_04370, partial [Fibrobacteraceae bacterium]|nr:hypothetical protein [Fibrobacteraceae bacterium]